MKPAFALVTHDVYQGCRFIANGVVCSVSTREARSEQAMAVQEQGWSLKSTVVVKTSIELCMVYLRELL